MYLLDTDHATLIQRGGDEGRRIHARLFQVPRDEAVASVASFEEQMRGWMAYITRMKTVPRQLEGYRQMERMLRFYCSMPLLPFDERAAERFHEIWILRLRVGTMDLKIAATALAHDATLLTRNLSDFGQIPELRLEDWRV